MPLKPSTATEEVGYTLAPPPIPPGCICSYTNGLDASSVRNGPVASCPADHTLIDGHAALGWTDEMVAEFEVRWAGLSSQPPRWIPSPPPLTQDEIRALLRECVTVVQPGESLAIRAAESWTPDQIGQVNEWIGYMELPFRAVMLPGDEFAAVAQK
jgi:hypothetical protein